MLYMVNALIWFWPTLFLKGVRRASYFVVAFLFSQSYYFQQLIYHIFNIEYSASFPTGYLSNVLLYSAISGSVYSFSFVLISKKKSLSLIDFFGKIRGLFFSILPKNPLVIIVYLCLVLFCFYYLYEISFYAGDMDRYQWWYGGYRSDFVYPLMISSYLSAFTVLWLLNAFPKSSWFVFILNVGLISLVVLLVSFDGSRRELVLPMLSLIVCYFQSIWRRSYLVGFAYLVFFLLCVFLIGYIGLGRSTVGWNAVLEGVSGVNPGYFMSNIFAPMPTAYVSSAMFEFVSHFGYQGPSSYFSAVVNALFPHFLFGFYVGGEPLVLLIHERLGWVGRDFGFLAETIYVGGLSATIIMHLILSIYHSFLTNSIIRRYSFFLLLLFSFYHIALIQSLRSDFMNFLKWATYPPIFIIFIFWILRFLKIAIKRA